MMIITTIITTSSCEIPRVWRRLWPGVQLWTSTPGWPALCFASRAVLRGQYLPCRNWNGAEKHRKQTRFPVSFPLEQKPLHWLHPKYFCCLSQFILSEILPIDSMVYPSTHSPTSPASASPAPPAPTAAARGRRRRPQRRDPRDCPGDPRGFNGGIGCQGRWLEIRISGILGFVGHAWIMKHGSNMECSCTYGMRPHPTFSCTRREKSPFELEDEAHSSDFSSIYLCFIVFIYVFCSPSKRNCQERRALLQSPEEAIAMSKMKGLIFVWIFFHSFLTIHPFIVVGIIK